MIQLIQSKRNSQSTTFLYKKQNQKVHRSGFSLKNLQYVGTQFSETESCLNQSTSTVCVALTVVPQIHQSVGLELLPTQGALGLGAAPFCDALPAKEMSAGG